MPELAETPARAPEIIRRSRYTPEALEPILEAIRRGVPPSRAAVLFGIPKQTLSTWKAEQSGVADAIDQAEAQHISDAANRLRLCTTKWGTPDPKALELELRRYPEYAQHQITESTNVNVSVQIGADLLAALHAAHVQKLKAVSEPVTIPAQLTDSGHACEATT